MGLIILWQAIYRDMTQMYKNSKLFQVFCCCLIMTQYFHYSEVEPLLQMAAENGVEEAKKALRDLYPHKYS